MFPAVSKSGSPISRWTIFLPWRSRARARTRTSNAFSVPSRDIRLARFRFVGWKTVGTLMLYFLSSTGSAHVAAESHFTFLVPPDLDAATPPLSLCDAAHQISDEEFATEWISNPRSMNPRSRPSLDCGGYLYSLYSISNSILAVFSSMADTVQYR